MTASFDGLAFVKLVQAGRAPGVPPWIAHMQLQQGNPIDVVEPGRLVSTWTPAAHFSMPDGYVQGGLVCAMADAGQSLALVSTVSEPQIWVTLDLHTRFVRPIKVGAPVRIETTILNKSRTSAVVETLFTFAEDGKLAAKATGGWRLAESGPRTEYTPAASEGMA